MRKEYTLGFMKYRFYLAQGYLEKKCPGEAFSKLVYTLKVLSCSILDWQVFNELDSIALVDYLMVS